MAGEGGVEGGQEEKEAQRQLWTVKYLSEHSHRWLIEGWGGGHRQGILKGQ